MEAVAIELLDQQREAKLAQRSPSRLTGKAGAPAPHLITAHPGETLRCVVVARPVMRPGRSPLLPLPLFLSPLFLSPLFLLLLFLLLLFLLLLRAIQRKLQSPHFAAQGVVLTQQCFHIAGDPFMACSPIHSVADCR